MTTDNTTENDTDFDFHTVNISNANLRWVPGPENARMRVLEDWVKKHCKGKTKQLNQNDWIFSRKDDADKFKEAWGTRK